MSIETNKGIKILGASDYHRSVEISKMRKLMRYTKEDFKKDWDLMIALAVINARNGNHVNWENMADSTMNRINAYLANNPEERPWND